MKLAHIFVIGIIVTVIGWGLIISIVYMIFS